MWFAVRRLALGVVLIIAAAAVLLISDLRQRQRGARSLPRVAVMQYATSGIMDEGVQGILDSLAEAGLVDGRDIELHPFNAQNDMPTANTIAKAITDGQYAYIITASTPCLQAVANANRAGKAVHIFGLVTDPYGAGVGIDRDDHLKHPAHLIGVGTFQPVEKTFRIARAAQPGLTKVGVVWNPAEACSEACTVIARRTCKELNIELLEAHVDNSAGVLEASESVIARGAQAIWIGGDNTVLVGAESVLTAARNAKIPVFVNSPSDVERGALFGLGANYYMVGQVTGALAARVIKGADPTTIAIDNIVPELLAVNTVAAAGLRDAWRLSAELLAKADVIVDSDGVHRKQADPAAAPSSPAPVTKKWKVALVRFVETEFAEQSTQGVIDGLKEAGLKEGSDFTFELSSAQGDMATLSVLMDALKTRQTDLVMTISTPTLQAALRRFDKTPVVFTTVANAVVAGAATSNTDHKPNVTGITTASAYREVARFLKECMPSVRRVGSVCTPSEANCEYNLEQTKKELADIGIELVTVAAYTPGDVPDAALAMCGKDVDAICQVSGNALAAGFTSIASAADKARLPVFSFMSDMVDKGAVLCVARDYYDAGREGARVAARVMRGEDPATIPIANLTSTRLVVNLKKARALGLRIPDSVLTRADRVIK